MSSRNLWIGVAALILTALVTLTIWSPSTSNSRDRYQARKTEPERAISPARTEFTNTSHSESTALSIDELSLRLIGTTVSDDISRHRAVILDLKNERRQIVHVNDRLLSYQDVFVEVIEPLRVRLKVSGVPLWLTLDVNTPVEEEAFTQPVEWWTALADKDSNTLTEQQRGEIYVEGLLKLRRMQLGRREPDYQIVQGSFAPWKENGEMIGIFASRIDRGGIFDQLGIEERDVILDVNGQAVQTPEDTLKLMEYFAHDNKIFINVRRNGRELTLESHLAPSKLAVASRTR